ncbi:MAG TPA: glycosyltransferase family 4 protein [Gammaproteobacteria bacterium]|nr:glycosyltransferase family 4 protein [Gammaproteobacteria bacterium]
MRILLVNYEFPPIGGGSSRASFSIACELVKLDHEVVVLTSRYGRAPRRSEVEGIVIHRVPSWRKGIHDCGLRGAATFLCTALPQLRRLLNRQRFDIVHYFFSLPTGVLSAYSHGVRGLPYIVSLRGSDVPDYDASSAKLRLLHRSSRGVTHWIWRRAARVVAVSDSLRELAQASLPGVEVDVIHNGVDAFAAPESAPADRPPGKLRLICVSRLIPRKGIADLLRAMQKLAHLEVELKIAGSGPIGQELATLVAELGVQDRVEFLGYQSASEVRRLNASADIFVLPTHSDAFANAILEAMSAGLPVIATDVGGAREAIEHGINGLLVQPHDPDGIGAAIARLANDPDLRQRMSTSNIAKIERQFTWPAVARQYCAVYKGAVAHAPAVAAR